MTTRDKGITLPFYNAFISVKDPTYGAKGDGVTNDAAAIQAALTAAAGGTVVIPVGTYLCGSTTLSVPAGTTILAYGATLNWTSHVTGVLFVGSTSVRSRWFGGRIIGAGHGTYNAAGIAFYSTGTNNSPAAPTYVLGYEVFDAWITEWANYGATGDYLTAPTIARNTFVNIGYAGVGGLSWLDGLVTENKIDTVTSTGPSNWYGIFIDRHNGTSTAEPASERCIISDNTVMNVTGWEGIDTHGGIDIVIANNTVTNCKHGIVVTESTNGVSSILGPKRCIIANNTLSIGSAGQAIHLTGAGNGSVGGTIDPAEGCIISGNTILGGGLKGSSDYNGAIRLRTTKGCTVDGNTVNGAWCAAISIYYDNLAVSVHNNKLVDWRDDTNASVAAITFSNDNNTGYIGGNTFSYLGVLTSTYTCVRSINIPAARSGLSLVFGPSAFIGIDATHLQASWGTTTGVNKTQLMQVSGGPQALTAGAVTVGFSPRFPSTPTVTLSNVSALNPFRVTAVAADSFSVAGTGTDTFNWTAST